MTVFDSSDNPKILPKVFDLDLRHRRLPALAFVNPEARAEIAHDESPSTPIWTFRVEGGALTRKNYRPFHNFAVSHEGAAFIVSTLARVQDTSDNNTEFVDIEVRINFDDDNSVIQRRGQTLTLTVTAEDIGYPGLGAAKHVAEVVLSKPPLRGVFEGSALTSGSRIAGAFDASKRVTVYGLADDTTSGNNLPVINLSHENTDVGVGGISKQSGDLDYANGQVFIPAANRKNFGTEFTGVFVATDNQPATTDTTYSITVLLAERLDGLEITDLNSGSAEYFYTTGSEGATEFRPIARLSTTLSGLELSTPGSNYQWDATSGEIRRNGAPPASDGAGNLFTLSDPNANPKIVPKAYDLNIRRRALEALSFVNAPAATTILHNETPTTPIWTFQVRGGALTSKSYRPFHNFEVKREGEAFSIITARVQDANSNAEFVEIKVSLNFTHTDASERRGQTLTLTVTAEDIGYPGLGAAEHVVEVVLAAGPLTGEFVDSALTSNSRIVGDFDASKRVTVYGLADDTGNLPVINLSHNNANVNVGDISKQSGDLDYASGQVFIPAAMRKNFGTEFTGVFAANDNNPQTDSATYSITVLLLERLEGTARGQALFVDAGRPDNHRTPSRGQFFHTATESTLFRPVLTFPGIAVEGLEARSADNNYRWDFATKRLLRNGAPSGNNDNRLVTLVDPSANPKILPAPLTLDIRDRLVPSLEFVNSNTTAPQIAHDDTPTTAIWTFQVYGGALTRQTYRPFHNFQLSHTGAFSVVTLGRSTNANGAQLANYQIKVDFTHPDAVQRRGQTLTVTVTAEDTGYPGLGSASHVAEVVLQRSQLPALTGNFVDSALTSGSQIEGNFVGGGGRITVFGTEADSTTEDLALFNLSFDNNSANVSFTGNGLAWRGGTLYLLAANRKQWGSVYSGNLLASDNNPQTLDKAYGVNVLVSEKLSNVAFEGVNPQNQQAVYFYGIGRKAVTDKRQVAVFNLPRTGLQLDAPSGFGFELADSKLRMGYSLPGGFIGDVAPSTHIFTLRDPGATPKIIPVKLTLTVSYEEIRPVTHGSVLTVDVEHRQPGDVKGVIEFIPGANPGGLFGQSYLGHSGFSRSVESFGLTVQGNPAVQAGFKLDIDGTSSDLSAFEKVSAVITYSNNVPSVPEIKLTAEALYLPSELDVFFGINFRTWRSAFINNFPASVNRLTPRGVELANGTAQLFQLNVGNNGVDAENVRPSMTVITNDGFVLTPGSNLGWNVAIVSTLTPAQYGQTLTLIVKLDDNDATFGKFTDAERATLRVKYGLDPIAATTVLDSNDDPIADIANIDIERNAEDGISVFVGKIKPSGGTGTGYTFNKVPESGELEVASNGDVYIPASQTPLETGEGRQLSMVVTVGGSGGATGTKVTLHVDYLAVLVFDPLTAKAQTPQGADLTGGDAGTFYRLTTDGTLNSALAVAKVAASGGRAPLKYERVGAEKGLRVRDSGDNIGEVYIWNGEAAAAGNAAERKITVKVSDSQSTAESVNVEITARFVAVNPHDDMVGTPAAEVEGNFLTEALTVRRVVADSGAIDVLSDAAPANEAAEVLAVVGTAGDLTYDAAAKKVRIAAGVSPNGQTLTLTLEVSDADSVNDGEDAARPNRQFVISAVYAGLLEAAAYDSANSAKVTGEINRYVAANEEAAVNVATLSVSGGAASYTFAITGGLELHGDNSMTVRIPADATPILSPGTKLTAQIVIDDTGRNDTLPLTLQLTANYILGAAHSDLTATQGTKAIENLEANVLTLVRSESSNAAVAVVSGVGFKESVANQSLSGTNGDLEYDATTNEIRVSANIEPNGQTLTLQLTGTDGEGSPEAIARSDRIYIVRVRYMKPLNLLFAASALQASRVVGDFSGERITVYGKATDSENTNLQLFNIANSGATNLQLQSGGAFVFNNGVLSLPAANRKDFGTEFTGTLTASDNNPDTENGTYKITVLLSEKLESVKFTGLDNNNKAIYIFNSSNPDTFDYANHQRQVAQLDSPKSGLTLTLVGPPEKVANDGNSFEWNSGTGEVRKREFILDSNRPSADGVYAFTLRHVSPNPAIVPVALGLTMRFAPIEPVRRLNGRDDSIRMTGVLTVTAAQENPGDEVGVITATPESGFFDLDYLGFVKFTQSAETHGLTVQGTPKVGDPITLDIDRENTNLAAGDKLSLVIAYDHNLGGFERPVKFTMNVLYQPTGLGAPTARPKSAEQSHFSTQSDAPVHRLKGSSVEQFSDGTNKLFELRVPNNGVDAAGVRPRMTETKNDGFVVSEDTSNPLGWDVAMKPDVAAAGQLLTLIVAFNDSNTEFGNQATDPVSATLVMQYGYSPIAVAVLNAADVEIDLTNPITIRRAVGNVSVFVGKLSASGGSGSGYTYTLGVGELGLDEASGEVYIPDSEVPTAPGKLLTLALDIADDDGTVLAEFRVSVLYQLGEPLSGSFVAVAPTPTSRIVGEIRAGERLTVYGLASDSTSDNLPVFNLSHTNNDANLSKVSGDLILGNGGVVELPGANRKSFGRTFEGVFAASDGNVATADAKYSVTILVAERLDDLEITDKNDGGLLQYFYTTGKDGATDLRPLGRLRPTQSGLELAVPANYEWDAASGVIRRSGVPTTGNNGRATETFTLSDPADNPKIVPKEFSIVVRSYELPALAFDSPDASVKINHDAQPTSPLWTFRVSGGALTRKPYRPFHNFEVSHEGAAFNIVTARVAKGGSTTEEFVDIEVRLDSTHDDFVRDGRTLTITVSAEDIGYPGLGEVSHVAVAELEAKPLSLGFAATALDSGSRVVGDLSGRVTVYGLADDATDGADLQLFKIANLIATDLRLNENGDFLFDGGVLSLPAANRKDFGTEFTGTLTASDTNSNAADATYSVTVLLSEKLGEDVKFTGLDGNDKAVYIYNRNSPDNFDYANQQRQVAQLTSPKSGLSLELVVPQGPGEEANYDNAFVWDRDTGTLRKRHRITPTTFPTADNVYTFTLRDPSANPAIVPLELGLTMRFLGLASVKRLNGDYDIMRLTSTLTVTVAHENPGDVVGVMTVTPDGGFADLDYLSYVNFTRSEQNHGLKVRGTPKAGDALTLDIDGTAANLAAGARLSAVITYANNLGGFEPNSKFTLEALYQPTGLGAPTALPKSGLQSHFAADRGDSVYRLKKSSVGQFENGATPLFELRVERNGVDAADARPLMTIITNGGFAVSEDSSSHLGWNVAMSANVAAEGQLLTLIAEFNDRDATYGKFTEAATVTLVMQYGGVAVEGSFADVAETAVSGVLDVYGLQNAGVLTIAATAKATVSGVEGKTFQLAKVGGELELDASSGRISIPASQKPNNQNLVITVRFSSTDPAYVDSTHALTVRYVKVDPIATHASHNFSSRQTCHTGARQHGGTRAVMTMPTREAGFVFTNQGANGAIGGCQFFGAFDHRGSFGNRGGSGGIERTVVDSETNGLRATFNSNDTQIRLSGNSHTYTDGESRLKIVLAYNDNGPGAHVTPELRKTLEVVFPGIPKLDAKLQDSTGTDIANLADIDITRTAGGASVFVGQIVASGGTGNYTYNKAATDGGDLEVSQSGEVYIPTSAQPPTEGDGTPLHILVDVDDSGDNSDATTAKQLRIDVDYILQIVSPDLLVETQELSGTAASGEIVVLRETGNAVPSDGLTVAKVVVTSGTPAYDFAVFGNADNSKLRVHSTSGSVAIAAGETAGGQLYLLTVEITDSARTGAKKTKATVSIRFNSVSAYPDNFFDLSHNAFGPGATKGDNEFIVVANGRQSAAVPVLTDTSSAIANTGFSLPDTQPNFTFSYASQKFALNIAPNVEPTGATLNARVLLSDGDSDATRAARLDREYTVPVRYLSHLRDAVLNNASGVLIANRAEIDIRRAAGGERIFVGSIAVSGGTGDHTFSKASGDLEVDENGNVYVPTSANPADGEGTQLAIAVNVDDSGKDNGVTNGTQINVGVNYIQIFDDLTAKAQSADGTDLTGGNAGTFHRLADLALTENLQVAKAAGAGGKPTYTYAIVGQESGLQVSVSGEVYIPQGETAAGERKITVRVTDSQVATKTADVEITVRFEAVAPHADLVISDREGNPLNVSGVVPVVVAAGATEKHAFAQNINVPNVPNTGLTKAKGDLEFGSGTLSIPAGTVPSGQLLSVVLEASDGTDTPQKAARLNRLYSITVRYLSHLAAVLQNASGTPIADKLTITVAAAGANVVAKVAASGGAGGFTYSGRAISGVALEINTNGEISTPAGLQPVEVSGVEVAYEVSVDDNTGTGADATNAAKVTLTLVYVKAAGPLSASSVLETSPTASGNTFYRLANDELDADLAVARVTGQGGTPTYSYAIFGNPTGLRVRANGEVYIPQGETAGGAARKITVRVTDSGQGQAAQTKDMEITINFNAVASHGEFIIHPFGETTNRGTTFAVVAIPTRTNSFGLGEGVRVADGASLSEVNKYGISFNANAEELEIDANQNPPTGKTLSIVLRASDGDSTPQTAARTDRLYTIAVRYLAQVGATFADADGNAVSDLENVDVERKTASNARVLVGRLSGSGGTGGYSYTKPTTDGGLLELDADGSVYIPANTIPTESGTQLHLRVVVNDSGDDSETTEAKPIRIDVDYIKIYDDVTAAAQNPAGAALTGGDAGTFYRLAGLALTENLQVAKVAGAGGKPTYSYAIVGGETGLQVSVSGEVYIAAQQVAGSGGTAERKITVRVSDSQTSADTADITITARFEAVTPLGDLNGDGQYFGGQSNTNISQLAQVVVVRAGAQNEAVPVINNVRTRVSGDSTNSILKEKGDLDFVNNAIVIPANEIPTGQKLSIVLKSSDGVTSAQAIARPDRLHSITVRYLSEVAVRVLDGDDTLIADLDEIDVYRAEAVTTTVFVASLSASGGTGGYVFSEVGSGGLDVDGDGNVHIPVGSEPGAAAGAQLQIAVRVADGGDNSNATPDLTITLSVNYIRQARNIAVSFVDAHTRATLAAGAGVTVWQQIGTTTPTVALTAVGTVSGGGDVPEVAYAKIGNGGALEVLSDGRIRIKDGTAPTGQDIPITVEVSAAGATAARKTITVKFVGVNPIVSHPRFGFLANHNCFGNGATPQPAFGDNVLLGGRLFGDKNVRMVMTPRDAGGVYQALNFLDNHNCDFFGAYSFTSPELVQTAEERVR